MGIVCSGLKPYLEKQQGNMNVALVYGAGVYQSRYAAQFLAKRGRVLDCSVTAKVPKPMVQVGAGPLDPAQFGS